MILFAIARFFADMVVYFVKKKDYVRPVGGRAGAGEQVVDYARLVEPGP